MALAMATHFARELLDVLIPLRCAMCGREGAHVCQSCRRRLASARLFYRPPAQGRPMVFALGAHTGRLRHAILSLKYRHRTLAAYELGMLLGDKLSRSCADVIAPVPLHASRRRSRGHNQAEDIARGVAAALALPLTCDALARSCATRAQSSLDRRERAHNVAAAFCPGTAQTILRDRHVLLVDDVVTSGATVAACADAARLAGANQISVAALALRL
jgi:ComF family protein